MTTSNNTFKISNAILMIYYVIMLIFSLNWSDMIVRKFLEKYKLNHFQLTPPKHYIHHHVSDFIVYCVSSNTIYSNNTCNPELPVEEYNERYLI